MLKIATKKDFSLIYRLMEVSFPADELREELEHYKLADQPRYQIYIAEENQELIGFISVWDIDDFAFIEHFAVSPEYRNSGLGTKILSETLSKLNKIACLEVEKPTDDIKKRRIAFYQRNGFILNQYDYLQPAYSANKKPLPLLIMSHGGSLSAEQFENMKTALYKTVYKTEQI